MLQFSSPRHSEVAPKYGIGIDFGTTKSHISVVNLETGEFPNENRTKSKTEPTIVHALRTDTNGSPEWQYAIGYAALRLGDAGIFATDIKQRVRERSDYLYEDGEEVPSEVLTAVMLKRLYNYLSTEYTLEQPDNITITIPANIGMNTRASMMYAARLAGFQGENVHLLEEPLAAFLSFYHEFENSLENLRGKNVLVFDFGGGTCDVTSIYIDENINTQPKVIYKASNDKLGGDLITNDLLEYLLKRDGYKIISRVDRRDALRLIDSRKLEFSKRAWEGGFGDLLNLNPVVRQKYLLSRYKQDIIEINVVHQNDENANPLPQTFRISGEEYDKVVNEAIFLPIEELLKQFSPSSFERILLVGGSSQLPQVYFQILDWLVSNNVHNAEEKIRTLENAATYVSRGAALYQYYRTKGDTPVVPLMDRNLSILKKWDVWETHHNFIKLTAQDGIDLLVRRNTYLPFPDKNTQDNELPTGAKKKDIKMKDKSVIWVMRRTYSVDKSKASQAQLLFFEDDTPLYPRSISLPQNIDTVRIIVDLRIDEHGLLELDASVETEKLADKLPLLIEFKRNPSNKREIQKMREKYSLNR